MARVRVEHVDVRVGGVIDRPHVALDANNLEQSGALDFLAAIRLQVRSRRRPLEMGLADRLVAFLDLSEEGIESIGKRVTIVHDCEYAARLQNARGLSVAHLGIEPMPLRGREHHVDPGLARLPRFERRINYLDTREGFEIATRDSGEILAELDAHDAASATRKMTRRLSCAASKFQHCGIVRETSKREQVVEDLLRVIGTSLVVQLSVLI